MDLTYECSGCGLPRPNPMLVCESCGASGVREVRD